MEKAGFELTEGDEDAVVFDTGDRSFDNGPDLRSDSDIKDD